MLRLLIAFITTTACLSAPAATNLTELNAGGIEKWKPKIFNEETIYNVETYKERTALKAVSKGTASGLVLKKTIDLTKTPVLNWSWLSKRKLAQIDERSKAGDDFVARVYVVIDGGLLLWKSKSLTYVWSSNQNKGQVWDNAYAGSNVQMVAVRGKDDPLGIWHDEQRNVYKDLIQYFGDKGNQQANQKAYGQIDVIAIMTDTDNSNGKAESYYGDIIFSAE